MELIDSHCHLPKLSQKEQMEAILLGAKEGGVVKMVNIGTSMEENKKVLEVARAYSQVFATAAIYPHKDMHKSLLDLETYLENFVLENKQDLVGIGECGIDISAIEGGRSIEDQLCLFEMQANLAKRHNLPLIIHNRKGDAHVLEILSGVRPQKAVIHCFSSSWEFAQKILNLGYYISFSGFITYPSKEALLETVQKVPNDRFLIETDSPYLSPEGYRDKKNEPKYVKLVAEKVALVKGISVEEVAKYSTQNANNFFGI